MKRISVDNGYHFVDPAEAIAAMDWDTIVNMMDDETREHVHDEIAPCTELEFLVKYLELADDDLIIG